MYCAEVNGIEWDWFASDQCGHVALFSSGGSGQVPGVMLKHEKLIDEFMGHACIGYDKNAWKKAAEAGLFSYDVDLNGGPYKRIESPRVALQISELPESFRVLVKLVVVEGLFSEFERISCEQFRTEI